MNLLEELDAPGEWWLDRANRRLYLVPPAGFPNVDLRLAVLDGPFVVLKDAHDIAFRDIAFACSHASGVALELKGDCESVVFDGCEVRCIGGGNLHPVVGNVMRDCAVGVHVDARGVTWQKTRGGFLPNAQGESWHAQKLKPFKPFEGVWRNRYPELKALLADRPELPRQNPVSNNVFIACKHAFSLDKLSRTVTNECPFADNRIPLENPIPKTQANKESAP